MVLRVESSILGRRHVGYRVSAPFRAGRDAMPGFGGRLGRGRVAARASDASQRELAACAEAENEHTSASASQAKAIGRPSATQTPKSQELRRHAEVREHGDRRAVVIGKACVRACSAQAAINEAFDEPVLRCVEE